MNINRTLAALLLIGLCVCLLPLQAEATGYYTQEDLEHVRCTLITDAHREEYVNRVMAWHILSETDNYRVSQNLRQGKSVVFIFDGCSDHVDDPVYGDPNRYHLSAYCAVVQQIDGELRIVYESDNCATIPDHPRDLALNEGNDVPTLLDGVYDILSKNHKGRYAALRVDDGSRYAPVLRCSPGNSYLSRATGINIHARNVYPDVAPNSIAEGTYSSTGCLNIGLTDDGWKEYDEFIYQILGVSDAVTTSTQEHGTHCTEWKHMGLVVLDRSHYKEQLKQIYGSDDVRTAEELVNVLTAYTDSLGFVPSECTYTTVVTEVTCTTDGFTTHTCTLCGDTYTDGHIQAPGHWYTEPVVTEAGCTQDGCTTRICTGCGDTVVENRTEALGHEYRQGQCIRCSDSGIPRGDADGDGYVAAGDALHLLCHLFLNGEEYPITHAADFDADGYLSAGDAFGLLLHVFFGTT